MYKSRTFAEEFDAVFSNAYATKVTIQHRLEFGQHVDELGAIWGIFSGDVNFVLPVLR